jgi:3-hydroxyacyl-CoA dehydrogenase
MTRSPVRLEIEDGLGFILIENPPVNAASHAVRLGLQDQLNAALAEVRIKAIVLACEGRTFVSGADIREFDKPAQAPILPDVVNQFEAAPKPIVAALHGTILGGGLEIALACHARMLAASASLALPEVKLGIIPGAGGTQRLPRLIGVPAAIDMVTSGRRVGAAEALDLGLVDVIVDADLRQHAGQLAKRLVGTTLRRTGELKIAAFAKPALSAALAAVAKAARGREAPIRASEAVVFAVDHTLAEGLKREREIFVELIGSPQAKALRHVFFAEREVQKQTDGAPTAAPVIAKPAVLGAGTMGAGIAVALLTAGFAVEVVERDEAIGAGWDRIAGIFNRQLASARITKDQHDDRLTRLTISSDWERLASRDLIIETVFEDMALKQTIFYKLGRIAEKDAVLATNTSFLDVNAIAAASGRRDNVIGMHFFSPAHVMRLVEVAKTEHTNASIITATLALAKKLGKIPIVCKACEGFVGNRILNAYRALCELMVEDGAMPEEVDKALEAFGFPMGVFAVSDLAGLDIGLARRKYLAARRNPLARYTSTVADRLCECGRFGQKTGAGWYRYPDGKRQVDPLVTQIVLDVSAHNKITRQPIAQDTMQRQLRAAMVNEGARILSAGIVARALDIDLIMIHGYGYPAWRGGPMFEADQIGLDAILADVRAVHARAGIGFEPAPLLIQLASRGDRFATATVQ